MEGNISSMVIALIGVIIVFAIAITILGTISDSFDCDDLPGYDSNGGSDAAKYPSGTWAGLCFENNENSVSGISLVIISVVIIAAAVILYAVRYLG